MNFSCIISFLDVAGRTDQLKIYYNDSGSSLTDVLWGNGKARLLGAVNLNQSSVVYRFSPTPMRFVLLRTKFKGEVLALQEVEIFGKHSGEFFISLITKVHLNNFFSLNYKHMCSNCSTRNCMFSKINIMDARV